MVGAGGVDDEAMVTVDEVETMVDTEVEVLQPVEGEDAGTGCEV